MGMLCAAVAGMCARLVCHPLDTIKTVTFTGFAGEHLAASAAAAASLPAPTRPSFAQSARVIWAREGIAGFYRGVGIAALGAAPGVALYLTTYDWCSTTWTALGERAGNNGGVERGDAAGALPRPLLAAAAATPASLRYFVCGLAAEAVSCVVWVPMDVSKERLQSQPPTLAGRYTSSVDALRRILTHEGLRGLYKGYASTLASFGPFSAVYFVFYEYFTSVLRRRYAAPPPRVAAAVGAESPPSAKPELPPSAKFTVALLAGAGGNVVASLVTNPLELVKTRLQVQRAVLHMRQAGVASPALFAYQYRGLLDGLSTLMRVEGVRALWKGAGSRVVYTAPNAAVTMGLFELLKSRWQ